LEVEIEGGLPYIFTSQVRIFIKTRINRGSRIIKIYGFMENNAISVPTVGWYGAVEGEMLGRSPAQALAQVR
jgi:hypothetical protein